MSSAGWLCRCGTRNQPAHRKCRGEGCGRSKPKRRVPVHARTLRDDSYEEYERISVEIHGGQQGACAVCGRMPKDVRHMDRDHGHDRREVSFGKPRGLACPGDWGCNKLMSRLTLEKARQIVAYLERVEAFYAPAEGD